MIAKFVEGGILGFDWLLKSDESCPMVTSASNWICLLNMISNFKYKVAEIFMIKIIIICLSLIFISPFWYISYTSFKPLQHSYRPFIIWTFLKLKLSYAKNLFIFDLSLNHI